MYVSVSPWDMYTRLGIHKARRGYWIPWAGVIGSYEIPNLGSGHWTWLLWKAGSIPNHWAISLVTSISLSVLLLLVFECPNSFIMPSIPDSMSSARCILLGKLSCVCGVCMCAFIYVWWKQIHATAWKCRSDFTFHFLWNRVLYCVPHKDVLMK